MPTCNSTIVSEQSNTQNQEPERNFRGTFAPAALHDAVESGKLPASAAWLAMVIDSLSHNDRRCWASNAYLAQKMHKSERTVQYLLEELEDQGFLCSRWAGKERQLWISWEGAEGRRRKVNYKAKSKGRQPAKSCGSEPRPAKSCGLDMQEIAGCAGEKPQEFPANNGTKPPSNDPLVLKGSNKENTCPATPEQGTNGFGHVNGNGKLLNSFAGQVAKQAIDGLSVKRKLMRKAEPLKWAKRFSGLIPQLMERDQADKPSTEAKVKDCLTIFLKNADDPYAPQLYSANSICDKWPKLEAFVERIRLKSGRFVVEEVNEKHEEEQPNGTVKIWFSTKEVKTWEEGRWEKGRFIPKDQNGFRD